MFSYRLPVCLGYDLIITGLGWELRVDKIDILLIPQFLVFMYPLTKGEVWRVFSRGRSLHMQVPLETLQFIKHEMSWLLGTKEKSW